ncbi:MAG: host attachment protein [Rhodospirillaceae bacterium]|nr:host attachment protein [Rhodospirillaceae bacterium]
MPHKSKTTWLLIADGVAAQIYTVTFAPLHLEKLEGGRFKGKHTGSNRPDGHQRQENHFAADVAAYINEAVRRRVLGRLVIAAPPRTLAELRRDLSAEVHGLISLEVPAEWTKLPALDLLEHARKHMAVPADT